MVVAPADMGGENDVGRSAFECEVVYLQVFLRLGLQGGVAALARLPVILVDDHSPCTVVELYVAAACSVEVGYYLPVSLGDVVQEQVEVGVHRLRVLRVVAPVKFGEQLRRCGECLACGDTLLFELSDEPEVLDEGVVLSADASCQADRAWCRLLAVELIAVFEFYLLDAVESPHEVQMPVASPELTVGDHFQAVRLLFGNQVGNQAVFHGFQLPAVCLSFCKLFSCLLQLCRAEETAHVVGTVRCVGWDVAHILFFCFVPDGLWVQSYAKDNYPQNILHYSGKYATFAVSYSI